MNMSEGKKTRWRKLEEDRVKKNSGVDTGMISVEQENEDNEEKREAAVYKQRRERRNNITSLVKIGPPWSHFKTSLMILISGNDTLCRQTKKRE